jgi:hypothetical protein
MWHNFVSYQVIKVEADNYAIIYALADVATL